MREKDEAWKGEVAAILIQLGKMWEHSCVAGGPSTNRYIRMGGGSCFASNGKLVADNKFH